MSGSHNASNVTDEQWSIEPLLPKPNRRGRRRRISLRSVIDAIFYLLRTALISDRAVPVRLAIGLVVCFRRGQ